MINVIEEFETVRTIIKHRASISRYGDGEFRTCGHGSCYGEREPADDLRKQLRQILKSNVKNMLIGISRVWDREDIKNINPGKYQGFRKDQNKIIKYLDPKKTYYSTFITRPDNAPHIDCEEYWDLFQTIWEDRKVVIIQNQTGKNFDRAISKGFFEKCKSIHSIKAPEKYAWAVKERIYNDVVKTFDKDCLLLMALGPTATVLAFDFHLAGYQALDLGHWSMFVVRFLNREIDEET